jgi:hypothetical protein
MRMELDGKQRVKDPNWKGGPTAKIFPVGLRFLKKIVTHKSGSAGMISKASLINSASFSRRRQQW